MNSTTFAPETLAASSAEQASSPAAGSLFDRIALSLSGGGFRASAYCLGTLNVLYLLGLLDNVHMLSTASGGTLTGAFYALRRKQGCGFEQIYDEAYSWLEQDAILPLAIESWDQAISGRQADVKLIRAFATVYDQVLYQQQRFGIFWTTPEPPAAPFHLQSIIFGSTELYSGLTFRFQYAALLPAQGFTNAYGVALPSSYYVGNGNVHISHSDAQQLRLGDIVAASSCFPVGFEPLVLPDDFMAAANTGGVLRGPAGGAVPARVAVVDGGVYDNQGIESLLLANQRNHDYCRAKEFRQAALSAEQQALLKPTTLFLVADVDAASTGLYDASKPIAKPGSQASLRQLLGYARWTVLGLLLAGVLLAEFGPGRGDFLAGILVALGVGGGLLLLLGWYAWRKLTAKLQDLDERIYQLAAPVLLRLSPGQWVTLLLVRVRTAVVLLQSVFMRRVRSLNYGLLYNQDDAATSAPVVASIIGGLLRDYHRLPGGTQRDELAKVVETVRQASQMGTTLWWGKEKDKLPLIVSGAALTLCYRLLRRFARHPATNAREREVERRAQLLWQAYVARSGQVLLQPALLNTLQEPTCTLESLLSQADARSGHDGPRV